MPGNNRGGIILTDRDRLLLKEFAIGKIVDREQAKQISGFNSTTRVNERLLKLVRAGLLKRFFLGTKAGGTKALYALSNKGAAIARVPVRSIQRKQNSLLVGDLFVEHQLAVNSLWIQAKYRDIPIPDVSFIRWLYFPQSLSAKTPLTPDGYFELRSPSGIQCLFCEVDRGTETLKTWDKKISLYLQLAVTGEFSLLFKQNRFRVLVAAPSERRLESIRRTVLKHTDKIFWLSTLDDINSRGLFAPIWLRPAGGQRTALL